MTCERRGAHVGGQGYLRQKLKKKKKTRGGSFLRIKRRVKFSLSTPQRNVEETKVWLPSFFTRWRWMVNFRPRTLPEENNADTHWIGGRLGPRGGLELSEEKIFVLRKFRPWTVQPVGETEIPTMPPRFTVSESTLHILVPCWVF